MPRLSSLPRVTPLILDGGVDQTKERQQEKAGAASEKQAIVGKMHRHTRAGASIKTKVRKREKKIG